MAERGSKAGARRVRGGRRAPAAANRKPGRPAVSKFAPVPKSSADKVMRKLHTAQGVLQLEEELYVRMRAGGTALEQDSQAREMRFLAKRLDRLERRNEAEEIADLKAQLSEMNRRLAGKQGSALRADMAPAPPPARGTGTLQ